MPLVDALNRGINFLFIINKQGQTKYARYFTKQIPFSQRTALEGEISRKCLCRTQQQCSFLEYEDFKIIYRRYASLFFIIGVGRNENELAMLEFLHAFVETLDFHFRDICELDVMFNLDKVHIIAEEMIANGQIVEHSKIKIAEPFKFIS